MLKIYLKYLTNFTKLIVMYYFNIIHFIMF